MTAERVVTRVADCDDVIANGNKVPTALIEATFAINDPIGGSPIAGGVLYASAAGFLAQDALGPVWHATGSCLSLGGASAPFGLVFLSHNPAVGQALVIQNETGVFASPTGIRMFGGSSVFFEVALGVVYLRSQNTGDSLAIGINNRTNIAIVGTETGRVWIGDITAGVTPTLDAQLEVDPLSTTTVGLIVQAQSGQTAPLIQLWGNSSTSTSRPQATIDSAWATSTDATRKGRLVLKAEDFTGTSREGMRIESDGTQALVGFFGVTGATQQTGGSATAGSSYTASEQGMLQKAYNCLRTFGYLS